MDVLYLTTGQRRDVSSNLHAGICCKCTQRRFFRQATALFTYTAYSVHVYYIVHLQKCIPIPYFMGQETSLPHIHVSCLTHLLNITKNN
jgi:hypothetical protein